MNCLRRFMCVVFFAAWSSLFGQSMLILSSDTSTSIRGLSVVSNKVIWACGSNGKIARSVDGGKSWNWTIIPGYEKRDFRDIEAFDGRTAVVIAVAEPAIILKTADSGSTWKEVYINSKTGMFLDAMEFWNKESGIVLGDPINGRFFIARTFDGGDTWQELDPEKCPKADTGEACFAASGTNIRSLNRSEACFVSGGMQSRFFSKNDPVKLPIVQGKETTGANSIAVRDRKKYRNSKHMIVVGGDFANDKSSSANCFLSNDGGRSWTAPKSSPEGYKSSVEYISRTRVITCGTTGVDVSEDGGQQWRKVSDEGFHVVRKAKKGKAVFLAGSKGRIARLVW